MTTDERPRTPDELLRSVDADCEYVRSCLKIMQEHPSSRLTPAITRSAKRVLERAARTLRAAQREDRKR